MRTNNLRVIILAISLMLIASAFIVGCAPQQRPTTERYGARYDLGTRNDNSYYGMGMGDNVDNRYNNEFGYYGTRYGQDTDMNRTNRMYGFFDTGDDTRGFGYNNIPGGMTTQTRTSTNSNQVNQMENSCNKIKGVTDATIVKDGNTAYVGCSTTPGTNENVAALRTECANRIRKIDPSIKKVVVTIDNNKITKLKNMVRDINIGRPARGFMTDLENLFR